MTDQRFDPVRSVTAFDPIMIDRAATLTTAAALMRDHRCSALLAETRAGGIGVVTERDIVLALADAGAAADWVTDVMTRDVVVVSADATIAEAAQTMLDAGIRHLVVEDPERDRVGIVSMRDLLGPLLDERS